MSNRYTILENRALICFSGADVLSYLQGLLTQDVNTVTAEHSAYSALLNAQGKYLHDFFLIRQGNDIWLECDATRKEHLLRLLNLYRLRAQVTVTDISSGYHTLAVMGELAYLALPDIPGRTEWFHNGQVAAFTDPRMAALGARVIAPDGEGEMWVQQRGFVRASVADYDLHRLQLGIPESGADNIPEKTLLLENGFEALHGVSFTKGCYVGQEVTARTKHRANLHKLLYIVRSDGMLPPLGTAIEQDGNEVGEMRSSRHHIGLALIRTQAVEKAAPLTSGGVLITAHAPAWRQVV